MDAFFAQILNQPTWLIYAVVVLIVFLEDALFVGFVLPGETAALLGGVSSSLGKTEVVWMTLGVCAAAIIGDSVGFEIGRKWGDQVLALKFLQKRRNKLEKAQQFLRRRGGTAVFLARWSAFLRAIMPALAGWSRMEYRTFLPWNAVGGIAWGTSVVVAGYFAGRSYQKVATWFGGGAAAVVGGILLIALIVWQVRKRRAEQADQPQSVA